MQLLEIWLLNEFGQFCFRMKLLPYVSHAITILLLTFFSIWRLREINWFRYSIVQIFYRWCSLIFIRFCLFSLQSIFVFDRFITIPAFLLSAFRQFSIDGSFSVLPATGTTSSVNLRLFSRSPLILMPLSVYEFFPLFYLSSALLNSCGERGLPCPTPFLISKNHDRIVVKYQRPILMQVQRESNFFEICDWLQRILV